MKRKAIASLVLSAVGFSFILGYEGYTGEAIIPVPGDVPTIGFGTTKGVELGDTTTPQRAVQMASRDADETADAVRNCIRVPLFQSEFDSYVSLAYNIGATAFCGSTLVRKLNAEDYYGAREELKRWIYVKGTVIPGLVNRRNDEYNRIKEIQDER